MSGQQDRLEHLDRWDPQDPRDAVTLDLSRLIERVQQEQLRANGNGAERSTRPVSYRETDAAVERDTAARAKLAGREGAGRLTYVPSEATPVSDDLRQASVRLAEPPQESERPPPEPPEDFTRPPAEPRTADAPAAEPPEVFTRSPSGRPAAEPREDFTRSPAEPAAPEPSEELARPPAQLVRAEPAEELTREPSERPEQATHPPFGRHEQPIHPRARPAGERSPSLVAPREGSQPPPGDQQTGQQQADGQQTGPQQADGQPQQVGQPSARQAEDAQQRQPSDPGPDPVTTDRSHDGPAVRLEPRLLADLRQRLESLPTGHPSSPYHDDGTRKPPPPRLKHLELAPPGRDRTGEAARLGSASTASATGTGPAPADVAPAWDAPRTSEPASPGRHEDRYRPTDGAGSAMPSHDAIPAAPGHDATPAAPRHDAMLSAPSHDTTQAAPGHDTIPAVPRHDAMLSAPSHDTTQATTARDIAPAAPRHDTIEAATARDIIPAAPSHDTVRGPSRHDAAPAPSTSDGIPAAPAAPRHDAASAALRHDGDSGGPDGEPGPVMQADPPPGRDSGTAARPGGPRIEADGSWIWGSASLSPDQVRIARDMHGRLRAAEGRNLFGSYDNGGLTAALHRIETQLEHGRLALDTEQHALIDLDMFMAELAVLVRLHPAAPVEDLSRHVPGALSYAFVFDPAHYAVGTWLVHDALRGQGFGLDARKNAWSSAEHKCVVTFWLDPSRGVPFQVQFHTTTSFEAKQLARSSASLIADPRTPPAEAAKARSDLASAWAAVGSPPGISQIGDYRRSGR